MSAVPSEEDDMFAPLPLTPWGRDDHPEEWPYQVGSEPGTLKPRKSTDPSDNVKGPVTCFMHVYANVDGTVQRNKMWWYNAMGMILPAFDRLAYLWDTSASKTQRWISNTRSELYTARLSESPRIMAGVLTDEMLERTSNAVRRGYPEDAELPKEVATQLLEYRRVLESVTADALRAKCPLIPDNGKLFRHLCVSGVTE